MASEPLTLAELARAVGMGVKDVEFYQERGLLPPARRRPGRSGDVAYHHDHVERLQLISRALIYGFSLDAIARLVDTSTLTTCRDIHQLAGNQLERVRSLLGPDAPPAAVLEALMGGCAKTGGREDCVIYATLAKAPASPR